MSSPHEEPVMKPDGTVDWDKVEVTAADVARFALGDDVVEQDTVPSALVKPEIVGDEDDELVEVLRSLKSELGISDDARVVCPGSNTNVAIVRAFGKGTTMCVDPDEQAVEVLTEHGYLATTSRIEDFVPDEAYDVLAATNSYGVPTQEVLDRVMKPGGLIITNNYTGWANDIATTTNARLVGAVLPSYTSAAAAFKPADELPPDSTGNAIIYFDIRPGHVGVVNGPGPGVFEEESARYPDGLFVFQMPSAPPAVH